MKFRMNSLHALVLGTVLMGATALVPSRPATAQFGQAVAISELMRPEFVNRDMIIFTEGLNLDAEQQVIVESMFEQYQLEFDTGLANLRTSFEDLRSQLNPDDPERVLRLVFAPFERWRSTREQLREDFLNNVKLVLSDQQLAMWEDFEMKLLREKTLNQGILAGENLDIFHVLKDIGVDERTYTSIEPILDQYAIEMDAALKARNAVTSDKEGVGLRAMQEQDSDKMLQFVDRQIDLRIKVRDVNDRYIALVRNALPDRYSEAFYENAMMRAYPRIYRRTGADDLFTAALELPDLDPDVRSSIREQFTTYTSTIESINGRLLEMLRSYDPESERQRARAAAARMRDEPYSRLPNPTVVEFRKRDEAVRENVEILKWMLGKDRFAQLPGASRWIQPEKPAEESTSPNRRTREVGNKSSMDNPRGFGTVRMSDEDKKKKPTGGSRKKAADPDNPGPPDE